MLLSLRPIKELEIEQLGNVLVDILCLHHWTVKYKIVEDTKGMGSSLMKIMPNRDRSIATIFIRKSLIGSSYDDFAPLLLHELVHLVLEPIVEEHALQLKYEVPDSRFEEYERRFRRPLEKVVEHITTRLILLIQLDHRIQKHEEVIEEHDSELHQLGDEVKKIKDNVNEFNNTNLALLREILSIVNGKDRVECETWPQIVPQPHQLKSGS